MSGLKESIWFEKISGVLYLRVGDDMCVGFKEEWYEHLRGIPNLTFEQCMQYMRQTVFPNMDKEEMEIIREADLTQLLTAVHSRIADPSENNKNK